MPATDEQILVTGFPGFLASHLLPRLLRPEEERARAICVVEPRMATAARSRLEALVSSEPGLAGRVRLEEGDITRPGIVSPGVDLAPVTRIFHLAAVYDLGVDRARAHAVNVAGTRSVLALAERLPRMRRLDYVSTCYVSGRHRGTFRETDLDVGQRFGNHYEESKFRAEVLVREAADEGLPVATHRPSIVAGDSRTGATPKFDGPYYLMQWMLAQGGRIAVVPRPPGTGMGTMNVVPSDFAIDAMAALAGRADAVGKTFHLADPAPPAGMDFIRAVADALHIRVLPVPMPVPMVGWCLALAGRLPGFPRIPREAAPYLSHPTSYDTTQARAFLAPAGIEPPSFSSYVGRLAEFLMTERELPPSYQAIP